MMMGGFGFAGLLLVPALLTFAALMAAFPGGALRVAGGALIGLAFVGMFLGFWLSPQKARPMAPLAGPEARIMLKAPAKVIEVGPPADAPQAIEIRPQAPAKAR